MGRYFDMTEKIDAPSLNCISRICATRASEQELLLTNLTDELIESVSNIRNGGTSVRLDLVDSPYAAQSSNQGHERVELMFSKLQYLIRVNQLPPRFIAALDDSYSNATGRQLRTDLASSGRLFDQLYQTAMDVATGGCAAGVLTNSQFVPCDDIRA